MFDAGLVTFLFDDLLPKLAESVHGLILHQDLSDGLVGLVPFVDDRPQSLDHQPLDEVTPEHEVLTADLGLDLLQHALLLAGFAGEEVLEDCEGEHLEEGVVVEDDGLFVGLGQERGQFFGKVGVVDGLDVVVRGLLAVGNALVFAEDRLF